MAERPPSAGNDGKPPPNPNRDLVDGTVHDQGPLVPSAGRAMEHVLVVRIPKDQIYRIPPPENALIVERHRNPINNANSKKICGCCSWFSCACVSGLIFVLLALFILIRLLPSVTAVVMLPRAPVFRVEHFSIKNLTRSSHSRLETGSNLEYDITLKDANSNPVTGILYREDGTVYLSHNGKEIAAGNFPVLEQGRKETDDVKLTLQALDFHLPEDIQKSMKSTTSKVRVPFSLEMNLPTAMKFGILESGNLQFIASCSFMVDTLQEKQVARILSQECVTKRASL